MKSKSLITVNLIHLQLNNYNISNNLNFDTTDFSGQETVSLTH